MLPSTRVYQLVGFYAFNGTVGFAGSSLLETATPGQPEVPEPSSAAFLLVGSVVADSD